MRLRSRIAFAARVPPRQIARRFWLTARRKAEAKLKPSLAVKGLARAPSPPQPLFPPRRGMVSADARAFTFIGETRQVNASAIDWRPAGAGQLWRMNLHYMEYLEELPDPAAAAFIDRWIDDNPPYAAGTTSDAWNAYALSLRVVVWMQVLAARGATLPAASIGRAKRSLAGQLLYLERHLESDIGGNHLIKNIKALLWASAFFHGPAAERWRRKGLRLLARELPRQLLADGMHFELSPSYHAQVFADLLEIRHALGRDPLGGRLDAALRGAAQVIADLTHPDGLPAQFGDAGLHMAYAPGDCLDAFAHIFGDRPPQRPTFSLDQAGYHGIRRDGAFQVVDAGRIAPPSLPAHGHGDALSFEWSLGGQRIIVDQGVYEYVAGERRTASRAAAFHNTLSLPGMDQAEFFGAFRCGRQGEVTLIGRQVSEERLVIEAAHDGFRRLSGGPVHRRRFEAIPERIRIEDRLDPPVAVPARVTLLLHPDTRVETIEAGKVRLICGKARAIVEGSLKLTAEPAAWWPDMGVEQATQRIVMELDPGTAASWLELRAEEEVGS